MRMIVCALSTVILLGVFLTTCPAVEQPPSIERVEIGADREIRLNQEPFFPIMAWLQDPENLAAVKQCGMNATAGYWGGSGGTKDVMEYLTLVEQSGLYGVMPFDKRLKGHARLLGYIHGDEPDLPHQVSDAEVIASPGLKINRSTPLWKLVDGVTHTWSVLDPLEGASVTIRLKQPVTVESLAVWLTISGNMPAAKQVSFAADGKDVLQATLDAKKGRQTFPLEEPATFRELTMTVNSTHPGEQDWGSIGEIEGFDAAGENLILSPPRYEPRAWPDKTLEEFQAIKAADPKRPVFMTLTGYFHPHFGKWTDDQRSSLYPQYVKATDVIGYDVYPIYGWNKPEWLHLVHEATEQLVQLAGPRPVYAWIETSKGGQWTGPLERQKDVTPTHIRAEVWMAICRGATAIGYFTHVWKPSYKQFGVPEENREALRQINNQITRLTPAILGSTPRLAVTIESKKPAKLDVTARTLGDDLYLFAVNYDEQLVRSEAVIEIKGLSPGTEIEVVDEDRSIRADADSFGDVFDPLAVHIYRLAAP